MEIEVFKHLKNVVVNEAVKRVLDREAGSYACQKLIEFGR